MEANILTFFVLLIDDVIADLIGVVNKPQVPEHINNHNNKHIGDADNDEYTSNNFADINVKETQQECWMMFILNIL